MESKVIDQMIDHIISGNNVEAQEIAHSLLFSKLQTTLNNKKIEVAQNIYQNSNDLDTDESE